MSAQLEDDSDEDLSKLIKITSKRRRGKSKSPSPSNINDGCTKSNTATCNYCLKTFSSLYYIKRHIARVHLGKKEKTKSEKQVEEEGGNEKKNIESYNLEEPLSTPPPPPTEIRKSRYLRCEHCTQLFNSIAYLRKHYAVDHEIYDTNTGDCENEVVKDSEELVLLILNDTQVPVTVGDTVKSCTPDAASANIISVNESGNNFEKIEISFANDHGVATTSGGTGSEATLTATTPVRPSLQRQVKMVTSLERKSRFVVDQEEKSTRFKKRRKKREGTFFEMKKIGKTSPKKFDEMKVKSLKCDECDKKFTSTFNLKRHSKTHSDVGCYKKIVKCSVCGEIMQQSELKSHYKHSHNTDFEEDYLVFGSKEEFNSWKENMEIETVAKYVQNQAPRVNKDGSKVTYFICHRNGFYKPKGKNIRRMKVYGSNKIDSHCPSGIVLKETSYKVTARFYKTHVGHSMDLSRLSLSIKEKEEIAQKIASKVPLEDILNDIRDSLYNEHVRRIHLTTKTDLHNLIAKFKLNREEIKNDSDYKNVDSWVSTHMASSLIRLYKNQGDTLEVFPQLAEQDFCLIVANDAQISLLHKYGNYVVCVDNTNGLDSLGFEMFSILVVDELGEGVPCALMFTTRNDSSVLEVFFLAIKQALGGLKLEPRFFMCDLDENSYAAWLAVFPCGETQRLLSSWHIDEAWRAEIDKVKTKEPIIKANIYKQAKLLMNEKNRLSFDLIAENFLHELFAKDETREFANYMQLFINEPQTWAYAYRLYKGIDASIHLENMHRNLKQIFFKGKKLKRLDRGIQAIMRFVKEKMFDRLVATEKGELSRKLLDIKARHKIAEEFSKSMTPFVKQEGPGEWTILSKKNLKELYTVSWRKDDCQCSLRCESCELCLHAYSCTCPDAAFHWNMCKHIHFIAMELKEQEANGNGCATVLDIDDNINADDVVFEMGAAGDMTVTVTVPAPEPTVMTAPEPVEEPISIDDQKAELLIHVHSLLDLVNNQERIETFRKHLLLIEESFESENSPNFQQLVPPSDDIHTTNELSSLVPETHSTVISEPVNKKLYIHKLYLRNNSSSPQSHEQHPAT